MSVYIKRIFTFVYVMVITALLVLPSIKYSFTYVQVLIISIPLMALALIEGKTFRKVFAINMLMLFISFMCSFVFNYRGSVVNAFSAVLSMYLYTLPFLICQYLIDLDDKVVMKWISSATCVMLAFIMLMTFKEFSVDPTIARKLAYGTYNDEYITAQRMRNIGGFGFCYCLGMFAPYITSIIERTKRKVKNLSFISLVVLLIFAVYSQYTTLVLLFVISIFYVIIAQGKMSVKKIVVLVALLLMVLSIRSILWFLANNISLDTLASHFLDLYYILDGEEDLGRWDLYKSNIAMFLQNPLFGADLTVHYNEWLTTHAHSTIFSKMSGTGLVGIGTFFGFIVCTWYYIVRKTSMRRLNPVFLIYIFVAFLNPVAPELSVTAFMIIPLIEYQFINREERYYV